MIDELTILYTYNGLSYAVHVDTDIDNLGNLPYHLGNAFAEIVNRSGANPGIVIDQMQEELDPCDDSFAIPDGGEADKDGTDGGEA